MYLFQFSTCFEQPRAHIQGNQLYQYNLWYMSLCVGDRFVCSSDLHTKRSATEWHIPDVVLTQLVPLMMLLETCKKVKVIPQQAEVAQGVPGRLRPRIFFTFGTARVVGRQPYAPAAFTPGEIPGTHFQRLSRPQGTWFRRGEPRKKSPVTPPGIDPGTVRLVTQCLNHYATPGLSKHVENWNKYIEKNCASSWSFTKNHNEMHGQRNIKWWTACSLLQQSKCSSVG